MRAQVAGVGRELDRLEAPVLPVDPRAVPGPRERQHRTVAGERVAGLVSGARSRRRARRRSAGLPSHQVVTSSGRVRATREPDR